MAVLKRVLVCDLKDVFSSQPNLDKRVTPDGYDAHDLDYCLEHFEAGLEKAQDRLPAALDGKHGEAVCKALTRLAVRFTDAKPEEAYLRDGPVAAASFEIDVGDGSDQELRNQRILRQRQIADMMVALLARFPR